MSISKTIHSMTWELLDADECGLCESEIESARAFLAKTIPSADPEDSYTFEDEGVRLGYPVFFIQFDSSWDWEGPRIHKVPVRLPNRKSAEQLAEIVRGKVVSR